MRWGLDNITEDELVQWIQANTGEKANVHARGYQGNVYLYRDKGRCLIIKVASGSGVLKWLRKWMLRNEHRVYKKLADFDGAPRCYGLIHGRYLVLEYIEGIPIRHAEISDRQAFFNRLLDFIKELHRRGIAHTDLKRQDNLMVVDKRTPCLIDFGAAIIRKPGFAPLNHYLYEIARKFDFNAWVKLKYQGRFENISDTDRVYYNRTRVEKATRWIKRSYTRIKRLILKNT